jgi:molybdate transport system regulatory protein
MTTIFVRLLFGDEGAIGPGKARLLELIEETGSISAAGRKMKMSYRRAWDLIDELNKTFKAPVVETRAGGASGGGASLTPTGSEIVKHYRAIAAQLSRTSVRHIAELESLLRTTPRGKRQSA